MHSNVHQLDMVPNANRMDNQLVSALLIGRIMSYISFKEAIGKLIIR